MLNKIVTKFNLAMFVLGLILGSTMSGNSKLADIQTTIEQHCVKEQQ